jgi:hypothetical protein
VQLFIIILKVIMPGVITQYAIMLRVIAPLGEFSPFSPTVAFTIECLLLRKTNSSMSLSSFQLKNY